MISMNTNIKYMILFKARMTIDDKERNDKVYKCNWISVKTSHGVTWR